jgi:hypothetical protein
MEPNKPNANINVDPLAPKTKPDMSSIYPTPNSGIAAKPSPKTEKPALPTVPVKKKKKISPLAVILILVIVGVAGVLLFKYSTRLINLGIHDVIKTTNAKSTYTGGFYLSQGEFKEMCDMMPSTCKSSNHVYLDSDKTIIIDVNDVLKKLGQPNLIVEGITEKYDQKNDENLYNAILVWTFDDYYISLDVSKHGKQSTVESTTDYLILYPKQSFDPEFFTIELPSRSNLGEKLNTYGGLDL